MTTDLDIYRTAKTLTKQNGLKGADFAAARIATLTDVQDMDGVAVWGKIRDAFLDVSDIKFKDDPLN